jgi:hypothetical protein
MLADSVARDIDGALSAGLQAIWVNRLRHPRPADREEVVEVSTLAEAVAMLKHVALLSKQAAERLGLQHKRCLVRQEKIASEVRTGRYG